MKEFQAFKDTLSNTALKAIYEKSKLEAQNETTEGTEAFSVALATQMAINLLESYEQWLEEERAKSPFVTGSGGTEKSAQMSKLVADGQIE